MAKQDNGTTRTSGEPTTGPGAAPPDPLEQRVLAFAEQLGRIAGTVQAKAEGWMDRDTLNKQIASVRDGAAQLLKQLSEGVAKGYNAKPAAAAPPAATRPQSEGRGRGAVDAPGKKHRKPMPSDPGATKAASQTAKMRTAKTMVKTSKTRGRG